MTENMRNACPIRMPGFTMTWSGEHVVILSKEKNARHELNPSAAGIWFMCDGRLNVNAIENVLRRRYPSEAGFIGADVVETINTLKALELIELIGHDLAFVHAFGQRPLRPVIRVGFGNFWDRFDPLDNFFLHMLAPRFDVLVVDAEQMHADLVFYTDLGEPAFDHGRIDRTKSLKVLVHLNGESPDLSECDYVFTDRKTDEEFGERSSTVPLWAYYIDWSTYRMADPAPDSTRRLEPHYPSVVFDHFHRALFSEIFPDEERWSPSRVMLPRLSSGETPAVSGQVIAGEDRPRITIGMAVYDEYEAVYFTVQALRLYHSEVLKDGEILIVDNNPTGKYSKHLLDLVERAAGGVGELRYVPFEYIKGTAVKDMVFRYARGEYVLCMDSHVLVEEGAIQKLIDYLDANPDCNDLLQGPLVGDDLRGISTHFEPEWSDGMYGRWGRDDRGDDPKNEPFEVSMQGTGLLACRKSAWLGYNPRFKGFGGEEGYIHERYRRAERRTLCLPFLRWIHRFDRPDGVPYMNIDSERIRNYYLGFTEVGMDTDPIENHFSRRNGEDWFQSVKRDIQVELVNPFTYFDAVYCLLLVSQPSRWERISDTFRRLGISERIRPFAVTETPGSNRTGYALSHREIIRQAQIQGLRNVLVIQDDALFVESILNHLEESVRELKTRPWQIFHMGRHRIGSSFPMAPGCRFLQEPGKTAACTQSLGYSHLAYEAVLGDLPDKVDDMERWLLEQGSFEEYLGRFEDRYLAYPVVSSGVTGV